MGWKLSTEKLVDFSTVCKVLSVSLDLRAAQFGSTFLSNTADRTAELVQELQLILESRMLGRKDAEQLRGRLQFASVQLFGRAFRNNPRHLSEHIESG